MAAKMMAGRVRPGAKVSSLFVSLRLLHSTAPVVSPSSSSAPQSASLSSSIRSLMRASAQPVAVITTLLPPSSPSSSSSSSSSLSSSSSPSSSSSSSSAGQDRKAHGATLSSFTTVSLDPALVAFSLRTPSRLADALEYDAQRNSQGEAHFVINILSTRQEDAAQGFSKPGLEPWDLVSSSSAGRVEQHPFQSTPFHPSDVARRKGEALAVPVLSHSVGALACSVVQRIDLGQLDPSSEGQAADADTTGSDVFIAKVHAIEDLEEGQEQLPLVYWQRRFTTVRE